MTSMTLDLTQSSHPISHLFSLSFCLGDGRLHETGAK